mmetsp:Transcript_126888/g.355347  ORF Transcript_126888/g.355347 Transcript_126888/m.355347 type:complete len:302 (-) Transcript_126888:42-947(-)
MDTCCFQSLELVVRSSLASSDNSSSMTHTTTGRGRDTGNESNHRLVGVTIFLQPFRSLLFRASSNFTNHNDTLCLGVVSKAFQAVDKVGSIEGVSSDADAGGLTQSSDSCLMDSLIRQGSTTGNNSDLAWHVNVPRHDTNLALARLDDSRTVGTDESCGRLLSESMLDTSHILLRDTFRDSDNQGDFRFNGIHNGLRAVRRRNVDHRGIGLNCVLGFLDRVEDWQAQVFLTSLVGGHTSYHVCSIINGLLGVECSLLSSKSLADDFGILIHPNLGGGRHLSGTWATQCSSNFGDRSIHGDD